MKLKAFIVGGFTALMLGMTACQSMNVNQAMQAGSKALQAMTITDAQMADYVAAAVQQMDAQNKVLPANNKYVVRLKKLTNGLNSVENIPLNFKVYQTSDVNAFACADGSVRVYTGIMDLMTDDELLGVIGHEIGHVAKHHSKKAFQQALLTEALVDAAASTSQAASNLSKSQLVKLGQAFSQAKYSQKQETEADNYGYDFLKSHNKNPLVMAKAFTKMMQMEQQSGQQNPLSQMFSSHPDTGKRIKNIQARAAKDGFK